MGAGAFSIWKWVILLAIILLIFGTKRLKTLGSDLGTAIKGFKNAMDDGAGGNKKPDAGADGATIDVKSERVDDPR